MNTNPLANLPANAAAVAADGQISTKDAWAITAHLKPFESGLRIVTTDTMPVALMGNAFAGMDKDDKAAAMAAVNASPTHSLLNDIRQFKGVEDHGALQVVGADVALRVNGKTFMLERDIPGQEFWLFPGGMADRRLDETAMKELNEESLFIRRHPTQADRFQVAVFKHKGMTGISVETKQAMVARLIEKLQAGPGLPNTAAGLAAKGINVADLSADKLDILVVDAKKDKTHTRHLRPIMQRIAGKNVVVHAVPSILNRLNNFGVIFPLTAELPEPDTWAAVDGELFGRRAKMATTMADLADTPGQAVDVYERAFPLLPTGGATLKPVAGLQFPDVYKAALGPLVSQGRLFALDRAAVGTPAPQAQKRTQQRRVATGAALLVASLVGLAGVIGAASWFAGRQSPAAPVASSHTVSTDVSATPTQPIDPCAAGSPVISNPVVGDNAFTVDGLSFRFIDINPGTVAFDEKAIPANANLAQIQAARTYTDATARAYQDGRVDGSWRDRSVMGSAIAQSARNSGLCLGN
jgi:hypothetical protein